MADGLHIGCDSVEEGLESMRMMLQRCRDCGLTLKPSKVIVFPTKCTLFGWTLDNGAWAPTSHTTNTLSRAQLPRTIKQLRGFLGSFKQFSKCVKGHGPLLSQLEAMTGSHRPSAESSTARLLQLLNHPRDFPSKEARSLNSTGIFC